MEQSLWSLIMIVNHYDIPNNIMRIIGTNTDLEVVGWYMMIYDIPVFPLCDEISNEHMLHPCPVNISQPSTDMDQQEPWPWWDPLPSSPAVSGGWFSPTETRQWSVLSRWPCFRMFPGYCLFWFVLFRNKRPVSRRISMAPIPMGVWPRLHHPAEMAGYRSAMASVESVCSCNFYMAWQAHALNICQHIYIKHPETHWDTLKSLKRQMWIESTGIKGCLGSF